MYMIWHHSLHSAHVSYRHLIKVCQNKVLATLNQSLKMFDIKMSADMEERCTIHDTNSFL